MRGHKAMMLSDVCAVWRLSVCRVHRA